MSTPRKKNSLRKDRQQTTKYSYILGDHLHLVNRIDLDAEENRSKINYPLTGGRRSTDRDAFELYDRWWSLSLRERHVTYFTCLGYKNEKIAFQMGVTVGTVKAYLQHVFYKMDVRSKTQLRLKFVNFDFERNLPYK